MNSNLLEVLLDNIPYSVWLIGIDGRFIFVNKYYSNALNLSKEYIIGKSLSEIYTKEVVDEYIKNYNSTTSKTRRIQAKTLKNCLYFDIGHWDTNYFAIKDINSATKLPTSYFKTLQIKFFTKNDGDDFCIRNIEFCKIKIKTI